MKLVKTSFLNYTAAVWFLSLVALGCLGQCIKNRVVGFIHCWILFRFRAEKRQQDCRISKSVIDMMDCGSGGKQRKEKVYRLGRSGEIDSWKSPMRSGNYQLGD